VEYVITSYAHIPPGSYLIWAFEDPPFLLAQFSLGYMDS
jgi:hypothetical protein